MSKALQCTPLCVGPHLRQPVANRVQAMHAKRREEQAAKAEAQQRAQVPAWLTCARCPSVHRDADLEAFDSLQLVGIAPTALRRWRASPCTTTDMPACPLRPVQEPEHDR